MPVPNWWETQEDSPFNDPSYWEGATYTADITNWSDYTGDPNASWNDDYNQGYWFDPIEGYAANESPNSMLGGAYIGQGDELFWNPEAQSMWTESGEDYYATIHGWTNDNLYYNTQQFFDVDGEWWTRPWGGMEQTGSWTDPNTGVYYDDLTMYETSQTQADWAADWGQDYNWTSWNNSFGTSFGSTPQAWWGYEYPSGAGVDEFNVNVNWQYPGGGWANYSTGYFDSMADYQAWASDPENAGSLWQMPTTPGGEWTEPGYAMDPGPAGTETPYWVQHAQYETPGWQPDIPILYDVTEDGTPIPYWPSEAQEGGATFDQLWNMAESGSLGEYIDIEFGLSPELLGGFDPFTREGFDLLLEGMSTNEKKYKESLFSTDLETRQNLRNVTNQVNTARNKSGLGYSGSLEVSFDRAKRDYAQVRNIGYGSSLGILEGDITDYKSDLLKEKTRQEAQFYDDLMYAMSLTEN